MNPLTQTLNQVKINEKELEMGLAGTKNSWHQEYKDSAWVFLGGLPYEMTEGDIICMFSQYGEPVHINLIRDHNTGKSKGFGFLCYMDQRSTVLAVDNLNAVKVLGRIIRVDHIHQYKLPKDLEKLDADKRKLFEEGCAPKEISPSEESEESEDEAPPVKVKKEKKKKKEKKNKKKRRRRSSDSDSDPGYQREKYKSNDTNGSRMTARDAFEKEKYSSRKERERSQERRRDRSRSPGGKRERSQERKSRRSRSRERRRERSRSRDRR